MTRRERALSKRRETCLRKRRYSTWDEAEAAALLVWIENPPPGHANPCSPYPCDVGEERHYHYGHIAVSQGWRPPSRLAHVGRRVA